MLIQLASAAGSLMILTAYFGLQSGFLKKSSLPYFWLNLAGAALLLAAALVIRQAGFILLEAVWVGITLFGYFRSKFSSRK